MAGNTVNTDQPESISSAAKSTGTTETSRFKNIMSLKEDSSYSIANQQKLKDSSNYRGWARAIKFALKSQGLLLFVDEKKSTEYSTDQNWDLLDARVCAIISKSCANQAFNIATQQHIDTAWQMWNALRNAYGQTNTGNEKQLRQLLEQHTLARSTDATSFTVVFQDLLFQLKDIIHVDDITARNLFLEGVNSVYPDWCIQMEERIQDLQDDGKPLPTIERLSQRLITHSINVMSREKDTDLYDTLGYSAYVKPKSSGNNSNSQKRNQGKSMDKKSKSDDKNHAKCSTCGGKHAQESCWTADPDQAPDWWKKQQDRKAKSKSQDKGKSKAEDNDSDSSSEKHFRVSIAQVATPPVVAKQAYTKDRNAWVLDTGASNHICNDRSAFSTFTAEPRMIGGVGGDVVSPGYGEVILRTKTSTDKTAVLTLEKVFFQPDVPQNLFSGISIKKSGFYLDGRTETVRAFAGSSELTSYEQNQNVFYIRLDDSQATAYVTLTEGQVTALAMAVLPSKVSPELWHQRLGHVSMNTVRNTAEASEDIVLPAKLPEHKCNSCIVSKLKRSVSRQPQKRNAHAYELVHVDVFSNSTTAYNGDTYGILFTDDATRVRDVYTFNQKGLAYERIVEFTYYVKTQFNRTIKGFRLDGGTEYGGQRLRDFAKRNGIVLEVTTPHTPEQDGVAERSIQTVLQRTRTVMRDYNVPRFLWNEVLQGIVHVVNRTSTTALQGRTPYEAFQMDMLNKKYKPSLMHLRVLGCKTYIHIEQARRPQGDKLHDRAEVGILVGFESTSIYRVWVPSRRAVVRTSHVYFDEKSTIQPLSISDDTDDTDEYTLEFSSFEEQNTLKSVAHSGGEAINSVGALPEINQNQERDQEHVEEQTIDDLQNADVQRRGRKQTAPDQPVRKSNREKLLSTKAQENKKTEEALRCLKQARMAIIEEEELPICAMLATDSSDDPKTYQQAVYAPDALEWQKAMQTEYDSLKANRTWDLVPLTSSMRVLTGRWVYKLKYNENGKPARYKARWVVKGFLQKHGIDYDQTFASVAKSMSYKTIIALATSHDWDIDQMDIITAFLHGDVEQDIFVEQPFGFDKNDKVCHLRKALYGLKQSPRLWQNKLKSTLLSGGFAPLVTDESIYLNKTTKVIIITYVDDILITGPTRANIDSTKGFLAKYFNVTDMGAVSFFLGIRITRDRKLCTTNLTQDTYALKILDTFRMQDCKQVKRPLPDGVLNVLVQNTEIATAKDTNLYQSIVGSLQYLATQTRPDLSFTVGKLARFATNPSPCHIKCALHALRYLKGTTTLGIQYHNSYEDIGFDFHGYSDSDYAGDIEERNSTSGYVFYLGGAPVSWKSVRQTCVTQSSTEAEYVALNTAGCEAVWFQQFLLELRYTIQPVQLFGDNISSHNWAKNPESHQRSKHVDVKYHWIRKAVAEGRIYIEYVNTTDMAADGLTKPLNTALHNKFVRQLGLVRLEVRK